MSRNSDEAGSDDATEPYVDSSVDPAEAKQMRLRVDGAEWHRLLEAIMMRMGDDDLASVVESLVWILPNTTEPFGQVRDETLVKLLQLPEARELTVQIADVVRLIASVFCAASDEMARRTVE